MWYAFTRRGWWWLSTTSCFFVAVSNGSCCFFHIILPLVSLVNIKFARLFFSRDVSQKFHLPRSDCKYYFLVVHFFFKISSLLTMVFSTFVGWTTFVVFSSFVRRLPTLQGLQKCPSLLFNFPYVCMYHLSRWHNHIYIK